jgi:hypothetical protein
MSFEHLAPVFEKYRGKGVLVDTNLLLLLLVGSIDRTLLDKFKPTANRGFTPSDYDLLCWMIDQFPRILTTPHVLTEVSNYSEQLKGDAGQLLVNKVILLIQRADECYEKSQALVVKDGFREFGLTDTAIGNLPSNRFLVLTVDFPLSGWLEKRGIDVVNFNRFRPQRW